jgi:synapsin
MFDSPIFSQVVQCGWDDFTIMADGPTSSSPCIVSVKQEEKEGNGRRVRVVTVKPDFCLIRNEVTGNKTHFKNKLYGLMYANIPSVNSLSSIYMFCERVIVQGQLNMLQKRHKDKFRLLPQSYFASSASFFYGNSFPAVVKLGSHHAGFGKMRIQNHKDMEDFKSIIAVTPKYCTAEPFLEGKFDLRIQKIGRHYRAFKRSTISGTWKTNTQSSHVEEIKMTDEYKFWADEASQMFGGLDILTVDAIHSAKDGKEYIMEVNGTSSGLLPNRAEEDNGYIRDLVLEKLEALFAPERVEPDKE